MAMGKRVRGSIEFFKTSLFLTGQVEKRLSEGGRELSKDFAIKSWAE